MARRAKGEGGLYQTKDKSWVYQYREDGKRKTKRFRRKADATAYMKAQNAGRQTAIAEYDAPPDAEPETAAESRIATAETAEQVKAESAARVPESEHMGLRYRSRL